MAISSLSLFMLTTPTAGRDVAGDGYLRWVPVATVRNVDLATRNVELGSTSNVQPNLLNADKVLDKTSMSRGSREHWTDQCTWPLGVALGMVVDSWL